MLLQEEYYARHNFKDKVVRHELDMILFFERKKFDWRIYTAHFLPEQGHPGKYNFYLGAPLHNSGGGNITLGSYNIAQIRHICEPTEGDPKFMSQVHWDGFEERQYTLISYLRSQLVKFGYKPILEKAEVEIAILEMFIYTFESSFTSSNMSPSVETQLYDELLSMTDEKNPLSNRCQSYTRICGMLSAYMNGLDRIYRGKFLPMTKDYAYWLGEFLT